MTRNGAILATMSVALAVGLPLFCVRDRAHGTELRAGTPDRIPVESAEERPPEVLSEPARERVQEPSTSYEVIQGRVLLPNGVPCRSGLVFAWPDDLTPEAEWFQGLREGDSERPLRAASIRPDGTYRFSDLPRGRRFTMGAASRGALCVKRPTGVRRGSTVDLRLMFTYGVAIRLEEVGGGPLRAATGLFGTGPFASSPGHKLLENPPELQALAIVGLEVGHGDRDRWQYLSASEVDAASIGSLDYTVEAPGYLPAKAAVPVTRLLDRLDEVVAVLEPSATSWGGIAVRLIGLPQVLPFDLPADPIIGVVYLTEETKDPIEFAVHGRATRAWEEIDGIPAGTYACTFEAADAYYQVDLGEVQIGTDRRDVEIDCSDAGSLLIDVQEGGMPYDGRLVAKVTDSEGALFYVTFRSAPFLIPSLAPNTYQVDELEAPGREFEEGAGEIEVFAQQLSVEVARCHLREY